MKNENARTFFHAAWFILCDAIHKLERRERELYEDVLTRSGDKEPADEIIRELFKIRDHAHKHLRRIDKENRP